MEFLLGFLAGVVFLGLMDILRSGESKKTIEVKNKPLPLYESKFHNCTRQPEYTWVEKEEDGSWTLREGFHPSCRDVTTNIKSCPFCKKELT